MDEKVYSAALNKCFNGNWRTARRLILHFGSAEAVFCAPRRVLSLLLPGMDSAVQQLTSAGLPEEAADELDYCRREGLQVLSINDEDYPYRLAETPDAPLVLFVQGRRKLSGARLLSIVGTRHCTQYSKKYCDRIAEYMSSLKVKPVIVSGLAYGVDTWAHQSALRYGLDTIAVTATGLDTVYPSSNRNLAAQIVERGAIVTEYWRATPAYPSNFISRNRIVAGLSDATVVVESRIHGGSLITARAAFNYDRQVFAFPGKLEDECYEGCNLLIADSIACLARSAAHIGTELGWLPEAGASGDAVRRSKFASLSPEKQEILRVLRRGGEMDAAMIAASCAYNVSNVSYLLLEMELEGLVKHVSANKYLYL